MNPVPGQCPICRSPLEVIRVYCRNCDTTLEGHFELGTFSQLGPDQIAFVITFVRNEGKINRVGEDLGISYPTVRSRLHDVIRALGYEVGETDEEESAAVSDEERRTILESLSKGDLTSQEALDKLRGRS